MKKAVTVESLLDMQEICGRVLKRVKKVLFGMVAVSIVRNASSFKPDSEKETFIRGISALNYLFIFPGERTWVLRF